MEYDIEVTVNDVRYKARIPASFTLLQLLRDVLHLTGTKEGCGIGECGACSVVFNGELVNACLVLGVEANGATLRTIEGEAKGEQLSDLQRSFIKHHAAQCGFCTPAMILTAGDLLRRIPRRPMNKSSRALRAICADARDTKPLWMPFVR